MTSPSREAGGWLVHRDGRVVKLADRWQVRARRCKRILTAWVEAWWPEVAAGKVTMARWGLTLRPGVEWEPELISKLFERIRREFGDDYLDHFFVAEMQKRGAVHYNVLVVVKRSAWRRLRFPDRSGLWPHGSSNSKWVVTKKDAYYAGKYLGKEEQKGGPGGPAFPKGLRLYGHGLLRRLEHLKQVVIRLAKLPLWLYHEVAIRALSSGEWPTRNWTWQNYGPGPPERAGARQKQQYARRWGISGWRRYWNFLGEELVSPWHWVGVEPLASQ